PSCNITTALHYSRPRRRDLTSFSVAFLCESKDFQRRFLSHCQRFRSVAFPHLVNLLVSHSKPLYHDQITFYLSIACFCSIWWCD
ncbi:hypothetical protein EJ08DRAFT_604877, partial [Tothia fuscella]